MTVDLTQVFFVSIFKIIVMTFFFLQIRTINKRYVVKVIDNNIK